MPMLDAKALRTDPKGMAFLREVLTRSASAEINYMASRRTMIPRVAKRPLVKVYPDLSPTA